MIRCFDWLMALIGLTLLAPLFLLVAVAVKLGDGGPVFYLQQRVGRHGRPFRILKFRTMAPGADQRGLPITTDRDARVTRVGKWLRAWKLDELPQLANVLVGDMGLVGPRPEVPRYVALYTPEQARVLSLRPGITDPASIAYRSESQLLRHCQDPEAYYIQTLLPDKLRINLAYAARAGFWSNLRIILATLGLLSPPVPVRQPGATGDTAAELVPPRPPADLPPAPPTGKG
jgi:lipopolysaccharide/colanic/teichoic acid biosynthesis glycosyltransferase